jgi:hypothetical protein
MAQARMTASKVCPKTTQAAGFKEKPPMTIQSYIEQAPEDIEPPLKATKSF